MARVKICGLFREEDIAAANSAMPDYIGFVFAPKSPRYVSLGRAKELKIGLNPAIRAVGVFVDETPEAVAAALSEGVIDAAQLHGAEDSSYIKRLRALAKKPIIKAFELKGARAGGGELERILAEAEDCPADLILLDSGRGSGESFDWLLAKRVGRPYFLAGGLNPCNVGEAVRALSPFAVDASSGVETEGLKDKGKMALFVKAAREAWHRGEKA